MATQSIYKKRADLYDAIYHFKDYAGEAEKVRELLEARDIGAGSRVLEAACGTGKHLQHFESHYDVAGFDLHDGMLAAAQKRLPNTNLFQADMADFRVDKPYDALLCLFSSIGYLTKREQLEKAARCFAAAVRPGGILVVEPFVSPEEFIPGRPILQTYDGDDLKCARACLPKKVDQLAVLEFNWLVMREGQKIVEHFTELHELWLCPPSVLKDAFEKAGFAVSIENDSLVQDRNVLIGSRHF